MIVSMMKLIDDEIFWKTRHFRERINRRSHRLKVCKCGHRDERRGLPELTLQLGAFKFY